LATLRGHADRVHSVAFRADGKHLVTASDDRTVKTGRLPPLCPRGNDGQPGYFSIEKRNTSTEFTCPGIPRKLLSG
jgi:WD40 repeat protein